MLSAHITVIKDFLFVMILQTNKYQRTLTYLPRDLRSLFELTNLTGLILDSNNIASHVVLPSLPKLELLWVNHNKISNLSIFIESVATHFPNLVQLSMMDNPAAPSYFNGGSKQEYHDFR